MGLTCSDRVYRKASLETYNAHLAMLFCKYLNEHKIKYHHEMLDSGLHRFVLYVTDQKFEDLQNAHDAMLPACAKSEKLLRERQEFLRQYFDSIKVLENCGIICGIKAHFDSEKSSGSLIAVHINPNKDGDIEWPRIKDAISYQKKSHEPIRHFLHEIYLFSNKTSEEINAAADDIEKRLNACLEAIEEKIKS